MTYNIDFIYKETNLPTRYTLEILYLKILE